MRHNSNKLLHKREVTIHVNSGRNIDNLLYGEDVSIC